MRIHGRLEIGAGIFGLFAVVIYIVAGLLTPYKLITWAIIGPIAGSAYLILLGSALLIDAKRLDHVEQERAKLKIEIDELKKELKSK